MDSENKKSKNCWLAPAYYSAATLWYAYALYKYIATNDFSECTVFMCIGAFFLCLGAAQTYKNKGEKED